jgi:glycosyltransferase involved in cell wall biosynthesis
MAVPQRPRDEPLRQVLVLGQFKPARDLEVMATIGPPLRAAGFLPVVAGRGWPEVAGWDVIDEFLSEADFVRLLTSSAAVLIPYAHYYQSGVALRALEHGTPVVGRATGFLEGVLGSNFSGAVEVWDDPSSWIAAVVRAVGGVADQLQRASRFAAEGGAMWAGALRARVSSGSPSE